MTTNRLTENMQLSTLIRVLLTSYGTHPTAVDGTYTRGDHLRGAGVALATATICYTAAAIAGSIAEKFGIETMANILGHAFSFVLFILGTMALTVVVRDLYRAARGTRYVGNNVFLIRSSLSPEEGVIRFKSYVETYWLARLSNNYPYSKLFIGRLIGNFFTIKPFKLLQYPLRPTFEGTIIPDGEASLVEGSIRQPFLVTIVIMIWTLGALYSAIRDILSENLGRALLALVVLVAVWTVFGALYKIRQWEIKQIKKGLENIFQGPVEEKKL